MDSWFSVSGKDAKGTETEGQLSGLHRFNPRMVLFLNFISWNGVSSTFILMQLSVNWAVRSHRENEQLFLYENAKGLLPDFINISIF